IITAVIRTRPFLTADRTVAGTPNSRTLAALASFEPRHGEAPASRHVVRKPARAGRQAAPEPRQPGPLNATTPTHCHPGQDRTVYQKSQLGGCVRAGPGAHEEVSAVARRTVALPDRWQRAYQKVPGRSPRGGCRIGAEAFVAGLRGRPRGRPWEKGTAIMKLTVMTQITVDGVVQGNGGASDEDRRNGFERGGWARGAGDDETRMLITRTYQRADAFLFGRRTYELFAGSWGAMEEMRAHPIGVALNETPKYVASTTLTGPRWADTTVLSGDLAVAVGELKARPGGELQVHGSG